MQNERIFLKDYQRPDFLIPKIDLCFELDDHKTKVHSRMRVVRSTTDKKAKLVLNGTKLKLLKMSIDGKAVKRGQFELGNEELIINDVPDNFVLEILTEIDPANNKALEGLYKSGDMFCTQNEPQGMRHITFFIDRPDNMSCYTTKIIADKEKFPVLLSNGNDVAHGDLPDGRHFVTWKDPFPKPCYLFALVGGDLGMIQDEYTTKSGRKIDLRIYCDKGNEGRCWHAMQSLQRSMEWDEKVYGLEYDLDIYMIVAVDTFNMGAMENKGLNIFNSCYVLADHETATDSDFQGVEGVVAHEYFHNWTGNRVTCRDWFQLTLKEGLTVFRDQEFSRDMWSRSVQRIKDVEFLWSKQFPEDAGPMAHPIKPSSYIEINNFYTFTVYNKGSEIIRMLYTLIGHEKFIKGIQKYFELYDGQAVTTEDFIHAMVLASGEDLVQFKEWYSRSGTPEISVMLEYDQESQVVKLNCTQSADCIDGNPQKSLLIPLKVGLLDKNGQEMMLKLKDEETLETRKNKILRFNQNEQIFEFENITERPVLSINRDFSSPIKINSNVSAEDLIFLMANDPDDFNRWNAAQKLGLKLILDLVSDYQNNLDLYLPPGYFCAFEKLLKDENIDHSFKALCLNLPNVSVVAEEITPIDYQAIYHVKEFAERELAKKLKDNFLGLYHELNDDGSYSFNREAVGKRALKNTCLHYLAQTGDDDALSLIYQQFKNANNMTDAIASLWGLANYDCDERIEALNSFYEKWKHNSLVIYKWLGIQASSKLPNTLDRVKELMEDEVFDINIPNSVRSLIGSFSRNCLHFHDPSFNGHQFVADMVIKLDKINPQIASGLVSAFNNWKKLTPEVSQSAKTELKRILKSKPSRNVYEILVKNLE